MSLLDDDDLIELANILVLSERVKERRALCQRIGIDPDDLTFIRDGAERDFAIQLVNYLNKITEQDALCRLCKELIRVFQKHRTYAPFLKDIEAKLPCDQEFRQNYSNNKQPTSSSSSPAPSVSANPFNQLAKNKLVIGSAIFLIGLAGFSLSNQNKNSSSSSTQATPSLEDKTSPPIEPRRPEAPTPEQESSYDIGVYGYQVDESLFNTVKNSIGYQVRKDSKIYYSKYDWLAVRPTVFYYDESSKDIAENMSKKLTNLTGLKFKGEFVSPVNNKYVAPGRERWTFLIHVVGSSPNSAGLSEK